MEHHRRRFAEYLTLHNLSPRTIESYSGSVDRFFRFCRSRSLAPDATASVRVYLLHLKVDLDRAPSTINVVYSALKLFFVEGVRADWDLEALPRQRRPRRLPVVLSRAQVSKLFETVRRLKYRAAFMAAYAGGLRRREVTHLRVEDIDSKEMRIFVREGKGQKERYVMLSARLLESLRLYWCEEQPRTWLFPAHAMPDRPMCGDSLSRSFRASRDIAGLPKTATFHCLRHSFASHLLEHKVPLPHIQSLLGHAHLQSTMIYLKVANASASVRSPLDSLGVGNPMLAAGL